MKIFSIHETTSEPVSHDPQLKKKVIARNITHCVRHVSHIILKPGDKVSEHKHEKEFEVMYCIRGLAYFRVNGEKISVAQGNLISVEPGDIHAIVDIPEETELLYFLAAC